MPRRRERHKVSAALRPYSAMSSCERQCARYAAELYYVNDVVNLCTPAQMAELPQFSHFTRAALELLCVKGGWAAIRQAKQQRLLAGFEQRVASRIMQTQIRQLESMEVLYQRSMAFALSKAGEGPRTFEGAARVALGASKHMADISQAMTDALLPRGGEHSEGSGDSVVENAQATLPDDVLPSFTEEQALEIAHHLLSRARVVDSPAVELPDEPSVP